MDRFLSTFTTRIDAKGRLSIPAPFRAVLARDGFAGLFVQPSLDWPALDCGGNALLASIDTLMAPLTGQPADHDALALALLGGSDVLKIDSEGRVGLTEALKSHAGIAAEVCLIGAGSKFQIWEPQRLQSRLAEARDQARALRGRGGPGPGGTAQSPSIPEARE